MSFQTWIFFKHSLIMVQWKVIWNQIESLNSMLPRFIIYWSHLLVLLERFTKQKVPLDRVYYGQWQSNRDSSVWCHRHQNSIYLSIIYLLISDWYAWETCVSKSTKLVLRFVSNDTRQTKLYSKDWIIRIAMNPIFSQWSFTIQYQPDNGKATFFA